MGKMGKGICKNKKTKKKPKNKNINAYGKFGKLIKH